jgi:hypothetical protein
MTAAPAVEIGIFSGMDSGVRWLGYGAQVAVDWLLRTPEQMPPKIPPLNRREATIEILDCGELRENRKNLK